MAAGDLAVVIDEWVQRDAGRDALGNLYLPAQPVSEQSIMRQLTMGWITMDEARAAIFGLAVL